MKRGIDLSEWNSGLDYTTISKQIDFVVLREGYRQAQDKLFQTHVNAFNAARVPIIGVYHFIYAVSKSAAKKEAESCIKHVEAAGLSRSTRIWADFEYDTVEKAKAKGINLTPDDCNQITETFCEAVKAAGYPTGIYTNQDYAKNWYKEEILQKYPLWYAYYSNASAPPRDCVLWQYSSMGQLSGYTGDLDLDYLVKEEAEEMTSTEKAIRWMEALAADPSHGYDQKYRWGEKGDYDCSSAVITAWEAAGIHVKSAGATYTGNMRSAFLKCGFKDVTSKVNLSTGSGLKRGDVLLNTVHHVAMFCGSGKEVEASINEKGTATGGKPGDQTGKEILVRAYRNYPWNYVLRYNDSTETEDTVFLKKGSTGAAVLQLQKDLNVLGYGLVEDGDFGSKTKAAVISFQSNNGLDPDGVVGPLTQAALKDKIEKISKGLFDVRVRIKDLYIRSGPGVAYSSRGFIAPGVYTIIEERKSGTVTWGRLKSGAGWICLAYAERL